MCSDAMSAGTMEMNRGYIVGLFRRAVASSAAFLLLCGCIGIFRGPTRHNTASLAPCTIGVGESKREMGAREEVGLWLNAYVGIVIVFLGRRRREEGRDEMICEFAAMSIFGQACKQIRKHASREA